MTISGVDLAGKTTQLAGLRAWLEERRDAVIQRWHRPGYSPLLDGARRVIRGVRPSALPRAGRSEARTRAFERPRVRAAWTAMACADTLAMHAVRTRLDVARGKVVLCDRYVEDALLDLQLRFPEQPHALIAATLRAACPVPDTSLLLMIPWSEIERRMASKAEPFPDDLETRRRRFHAYQELADSGRFVVVDAARPIDAVQDDLRDRVAAALGEAR